VHDRGDAITPFWSHTPSSTHRQSTAHPARPTATTLRAAPLTQPVRQQPWRRADHRSNRAALPRRRITLEFVRPEACWFLTTMRVFSCKLSPHPGRTAGNGQRSFTPSASGDAAPGGSALWNTRARDRCSGAVGFLLAVTAAVRYIPGVSLWPRGHRDHPADQLTSATTSSSSKPLDLGRWPSSLLATAR